MKTIGAAEFKARCLAIMKEVNGTGEAVVVTNRGKPLVRVNPERPARKSIIGRLEGIVSVKGKITDPAIPPEDWGETAE